MDSPFTLPFESFWTWLLTHPNCLVRAGTLDAVLYDDEDLHWYFASDLSGRLMVQLLRGKRLMGEFLVDPERITYVQAVPGETEEEHMFELISESETERMALYFFVLVHGFEENQEVSSGHVH